MRTYYVAMQGAEIVGWFENSDGEAKAQCQKFVDHLNALKPAKFPMAEVGILLLSY